MQDLLKIDSYNFPDAQLHLKRLLPKDFRIKEAKIYTKQGSYSDQSVPSIPALVTAFSANHFTEGLMLIDNINTVVKPAYKSIKLYVFDIGLTSNQRKQVCINIISNILKYFLV